MSMIEPGRPCPLCDVRPDVACRHRAADPNWQGITARPKSKGPPNREFSFLSGIRTFTNPRDGKVYRIVGRGD